MIPTWGRIPLGLAAQVISGADGSLRFVAIGRLVIFWHSRRPMGNREPGAA